MNNKRLLYLILVLIQVSFPLGQILQNEGILIRGKTYSFEIQVVDPYDPLRGRYLQINPLLVDWDTLREQDRAKLRPHEKIYATLKQTPYARVKALYLEPPEEEFLILYTDSDGDIIPPFDRIYLNQKEAPYLEELYNQGLAQPIGEKTYVTGKIRKGKVLLKDLFIQGKSTKDLLNDKEERIRP